MKMSPLDCIRALNNAQRSGRVVAWKLICSTTTSSLCVVHVANGPTLVCAKETTDATLVAAVDELAAWQQTASVA